MAHTHPSEKLFAKSEASQHQNIEQQILAALKQDSSCQICWELICEIPVKEPHHSLSRGRSYYKIHVTLESLRVTRSRIDSSEGKPGHHLHTTPKAGANMAAGLENRATNSRHTTNFVQKHYLMPIRKSSL